MLFSTSSFNKGDTMDFKWKLFQNKTNGQLSISIPKHQFPQLKKKNPKMLRIKGELEFLE